MTETQLDLFGTVEAEETEAQDRAADRVMWGRLFDRYEVAAPWDCADRTPKGTPCPVVACPICGFHEVNGYHLGIEHGYDPDRPDWRRLVLDLIEGRCQRGRCLASMRRPLRDAGVLNDALPVVSWETQPPLTPKLTNEEFSSVLFNVMVAKWGGDDSNTIAEREGWL